MKTAQSAELEPGDAIYIPFHWWHGVELARAGQSVRQLLVERQAPDLGNPYAALIHALYAIKALPPEQREVWRGGFEHYVFGANGDPAQHLPPHARGMLGELDAEQLELMRDGASPGARATVSVRIFTVDERRLLPLARTHDVPRHRFDPSRACFGAGSLVALAFGTGGRARVAMA